MYDSVITCNEVIESYYKELKTIQTSFSENCITCKGQNFHILLVFLFLTIALFNIYIYIIYIIYVYIIYIIYIYIYIYR